MNILNKTRYEFSKRKLVEDDLVNQLITLFPHGATELFPDTDIDYIRQSISKYNHSFTEQASMDILSHTNVPERLDYKQLYRFDMFRSDSYKSQALQKLIMDFPQVWKSSICAVLAENNWDYIKSYDQLSEMGSGGFWSSIRNFFLHFSIPKTGLSSASTSSSSSSLLNNQNEIIIDSILLKEIKHIQKRIADKQSQQDETMAHEINTKEYEDDEQLIECGCCFGDFTFEQLIFCSQGKHQFCHQCILRFMTEGLFGQGNLRGCNRIPCIASDDRLNSCEGCLSNKLLKQILPFDIWKAYETSVFETNMTMQGWALVRCASCHYCELDESTRPFHHIMDKTQLILSIASWIMWDLKSDLHVAYDRIVQKRRGYAFQCRSPSCGKLTCLKCMHVIRGLHSCWENEKDGLRLYVEKAMADAVKRTCPKCNLSFQKSDGCNKIVCKCGYTMCYVCRKDIKKESYAHFCQHFRDIPGSPCSKCKKCDLYKTLPEDQAVQKAANNARRQYLEAHPDVAGQVPLDDIIGPKSTLDKFDEWRHESIIWILQSGMSILV
ncbi:unnamed protein product [Cunninghamella blakesleeana]